MPFWTVEDAGPYKEKSNSLMRTTFFQGKFFITLFAKANEHLLLSKVLFANFICRSK